MSAFTKLSPKEEARYLEYRIARANAAHAHLEATAAFAQAQVIGQQIADRDGRRVAQGKSYATRALYTAPLLMRQAAALRRAIEARVAGKPFVSKVKELLPHLR